MDRLTWPTGPQGSLGLPTPRTVGLLCRHTPPGCGTGLRPWTQGPGVFSPGPPRNAAWFIDEARSAPYNHGAPPLTAARRPNSYRGSTGIPPSPAGPKRIAGAGLTRLTSAAVSAMAQTKAPLPPPLQRVLMQVGLR
ncbi:hypothetical protein NDU88_002987 [Pleurodeles waltl]|uniref:Uncharacterized protein n=1 Tax=Pleurodeles waltl TaxID=8319 RepID=A0AAV7UDX1_PLEWA|nr:hypothetical protein NDU88_002987 [Pleurodeles waltl]